MSSYQYIASHFAEIITHVALGITAHLRGVTNEISAWGGVSRLPNTCVNKYKLPNPSKHKSQYYWEVMFRRTTQMIRSLSSIAIRFL